MKKVILVMCLVFSMGGIAFAQNNDLATVKKHMKSFAPVNVSLKNNIITIVLDEVSVSKQIYENVISSGICMPMYLNKQSNYFSKIKEVKVVNKSKSKGFILENPNQNCKDRAKEKGQMSKVVLYGNTRQY